MRQSTKLYLKKGGMIKTAFGWKPRNTKPRFSTMPIEPIGMGVKKMIADFSDLRVSKPTYKKRTPIKFKF